MNEHFNSINRLSAEIAQQPHNYMLRFLRAIDYYLVQDLYNAIDDINEAIALKDDFSAAYFMRAVINCKRLEYEKAENDYDFTRSTTADTERNSMMMAYDNVRKDLNKVIELEPDFACAYYNRACISAMLKDFIGALNDLNKAIETDSNLPEAYYNRGLINIFIGNDKQGINDLSKAGELGVAQAYNVMKRFTIAENE